MSSIAAIRLHQLHASIAPDAGQPANTMFIFGHAGITFGVALAAQSLGSQPHDSAQRPTSSTRTRIHEHIVSLSNRFDLRLLFIGSLLPDIIDKPLGLLLFPTFYGTGRLLAHSLLFVLVLAFAGVWRYRSSRSTALLTLSYGSGMHLLLDAMWRSPSILFWPLAGSLPRGAAVDDWISTLLTAPVQNASVLISEIAGVILLIPLLWMILSGAGLRRFLRHGTVK